MYDTNLTKRQVKYTQLVASGMNEHMAAMEAGYKKDRLRQSVYKLRNNDKVQERISMLKGEKPSTEVANRADREAFWTSMMNDPKNSGSIRLEASKLLGKAQGDFIDRSKVETEIVSHPIMVIPDMTLDKWEEYWEEKNG